MLDKQELDNTLDSDSTADIDQANKEGRQRGVFKTGNPYRYQAQNKPAKNQLSIDDELEDE